MFIKLSKQNYRFLEVTIQSWTLSTIRKSDCTTKKSISERFNGLALYPGFWNTSKERSIIWAFNFQFCKSSIFYCISTFHTRFLAIGRRARDVNRSNDYCATHTGTDNLIYGTINSAHSFIIYDWLCVDNWDALLEMFWFFKNSLETYHVC